MFIVAENTGSVNIEKLKNLKEKLEMTDSNTILKHVKS